MIFERAHFGVVTSVLAFACHLVSAQNPGTDTPEVHPPLPTWKCTTSGGCVQQNTSVVIDWDFRSVHVSGGNTSCLASGGVDSSLCPDEATCAKNCVVEGVNYNSSGVSTSNDSLTMYHYVQVDGKLTAASPRLYLLGPDDDYVMLSLLNQELSFEVDLSTLPCGENGAIYLSSMDPTGGRSEYNTGGANYGSGYCDAQSPVSNWRNGTLNTDKQGYPCDEMDIMESNSQANAMTPHPCQDGACDKGGCGLNPYASGYKSYYGPGMTVDTSKPFTVITQFVASNGSLSQITRKYMQDGKAIPSAASGGDIITASGCGSAQPYGGLAEMGKALQNGMVLVFSIWNDPSQDMNWLDSGSAGPCSSTAGSPTNIESQHPDTHVIYSNIRWGDIGSTTQS